MLHVGEKNQSINISSSERSHYKSQILTKNTQISFKSDDAENFQMEENSKITLILNFL